MEAIGKFFLTMIIVSVVLLLLTGIIYWLWCVIAVTALGLPSLSYWQCLGLWVLISLLFTSHYSKKS